ncbi:MAG TPA: hypothetical protein PL098_00195 [Brevundimonas diminuta]|nr:hypothetical protein [Brevundimonas diminuta]HRL23324.1 hypothetical protein [Brevundimonas diminuta]
MPVRVRTATEEDARWFAPRLRAADAAELLAVRSAPLVDQLIDCVRSSRGAAFVAVSKNLGAISLFGFAPHGLLSDKIAPWAVGTPELSRRGRALCLIGREFCGKALERGTRLENFVDVRNTASVRWLESIGFAFDEAAPYGCEGRPFKRFWMDRHV